MLERLLDNPLSMRMAATLEHDHNRRLGIRNTMRFAKAFNRLKNHACWRYRQTLHARQLDDLFKENGAVRGTGVTMRDGWALDTSRSLPHLDELIAESEKIIRERGGVRRGGGDRSFFQQILTDVHIARHPVILDFATSSDVLRPVIDHMGLIPVLSASLPLGVRLAESDEKLGDPTNKNYRESQLLHRDYHDLPMVYVIVTLRDVTNQSGPFSIFPAEASRRATEALRYGERGRSYRLTDDEFYKVADRKDLFELTCPAGTVLFVDSSRCFHYGSRDAVIPRYMMMYAYVSVCRCDFGDLLRRESPTPVVDDALTRTRRAKYPVRDGSSRLRHLLLDREWLGDGRTATVQA